VQERAGAEVADGRLDPGATVAIGHGHGLGQELHLRFGRQPLAGGHRLQDQAIAPPPAARASQGLAAQQADDLAAPPHRHHHQARDALVEPAGQLGDVGRRQRTQVGNEDRPLVAQPRDEPGKLREGRQSLVARERRDALGVPLAHADQARPVGAALVVVAPIGAELPADLGQAAADHELDLVRTDRRGIRIGREEPAPAGDAAALEARSQPQRRRDGRAVATAEPVRVDPDARARAGPIEVLQQASPVLGRDEIAERQAAVQVAVPVAREDLERAVRVRHDQAGVGLEEDPVQEIAYRIETGGATLVDATGLGPGGPDLAAQAEDQETRDGEGRTGRGERCDRPGSDHGRHHGASTFVWRLPCARQAPSREFCSMIKDVT